MKNLRQFSVLFSMTIFSFVLCDAFTYDAREAQRILGFDPHITYTSPSAENTNGTPTLCAHGFGHRGKRYQNKAALFNHPVISFDFSDATLGRSSIISSLWSAYSINLGQELDVKTLLYVMITCHRNGITQINAFGHSRGAAVWIKVLHVLAHPYTNKDLFNAVGISSSELPYIIAMVSRCNVFLTHPLLDLHNAVNVSTRRLLYNSFGWGMNTCNALIPYGEQIALSTCSLIVNYLLYYLTHCNVWETPPIKLFEHLIQMTPHTFYISLMPHDLYVGNDHDATIYSLANHYHNVIIVPPGKTHGDVDGMIQHCSP